MRAFERVELRERPLLYLCEPLSGRTMKGLSSSGAAPVVTTFLTVRAVSCRLSQKNSIDDVRVFLVLAARPLQDLTNSAAAGHVKVRQTCVDVGGESA